MFIFSFGTSFQDTYCLLFRCICNPSQSISLNARLTKDKIFSNLKINFAVDTASGELKNITPHYWATGGCPPSSSTVSKTVTAQPYLLTLVSHSGKVNSPPWLRPRVAPPSQLFNSWIQSIFHFISFALFHHCFACGGDVVHSAPTSYIYSWKKSLLKFNMVSRRMRSEIQTKIHFLMFKLR